MSWWNFGGLNPKFKDFAEKHPDKTMLGMAWSIYWRLMVFVFVIEIVVVILGGIIVLFDSL